MIRVLFVLPLLALAASAQGVDAWITEALDPTTDAARRIELFDAIGRANPEALDKLAKKGLDPELSPEVVHGVVSTLFKNNAYASHIEAICKLLLAEQHSVTVLARIEDLGTHPERGKALRDGVLEIASDDEADVELRRAAVIALGSFPFRGMLKAVVDIGLRDERLAKTCLEAASWLHVDSLAQAQRLLATTPAHWTYFDIMRERLRTSKRELAEARQLEAAAIKRAGPADALKVLTGEGVARRRTGAARIKALAASRELGKMTPVDFAGQVFDAFVKLRQEGMTQDSVTFEYVCDALAALAQDPKKPPLWEARKKEDLVTELRKVIGDDRFATADDRRRAGSAAVRLLRVLRDRTVLYPLAAFAQEFKHPLVRAEAIQELGGLARGVPEVQPEIGKRLAEILATEKDPAIRKQVLTTLTQPKVPVTEAFLTIKTLLRPEDAAGAPKLEQSELRDCIIILEQLGNDEAFELLKWLAVNRADTRQLVFEKGLLPLARRNGKEPAILAFLSGLVRGTELNADEKSAMLRALGAEGSRNANPVLAQLAATETLDAELRTAATDAQWALASRLAASEDAEDRKVAIAVLDARGADKEPAWVRLEELARAILAGSDNAATGPTRYRLAQAIGKKEPAAPREAIVEAYEDAARNAANDGLPEARRAILLKEFCEVLLGGTPTKDDYRRAMKYCEVLGGLASEALLARVDHLLKAAECAVKIAEADQAVRLLDEAAKATKLDGERKLRADKLRAEAAKLKAG